MPDTTSKATKSRWRLSWWIQLLAIALAFVIGLVLRYYYFQSTTVTAKSMLPTLVPGDKLLIKKAAYWREPPQRGDIVVFPAPSGKNEYLIKRVIGLPNEHIVSIRGKVYINGRPLDEPYTGGIPTHDIMPMVIPPGTVYVMGDNRNHSEDSRDFGPIKIDDIIGKVVWRLAPLERFGPIE